MTTISQPPGHSMFCAPTKWAVIDRDSGEFFGRDLSYNEARKLAIQLGTWARVAAQTDESLCQR